MNSGMINTECEKIQERLSAEGLENVLQDSAAYTHIAGCGDCSKLVEALKEVTHALEELPFQEAPEYLRARIRNTVLALIPGEQIAEGCQEEVKRKSFLTVRLALDRIRMGARKFQVPATYKQLSPLLIGVFGLVVMLSIFKSHTFTANSSHVSPSGAVSSPRAGDLNPAVFLSYNEDLIRNGVGTIFRLIEGAFGALVMAASALLALFFVFRKKYRLGGTFVSLALAAFVLRSMVSLFFGYDYTDYSEGDGGSSGYGHSGGNEVAYNDSLISSSASFGKSKGESALNDLLVTFKSDIEEGKKERRQGMDDIILRTKKDLADYKQNSGGMFETFIDKIEQLNREADRLAAKVRHLDELPPTAPKVSRNPFLHEFTPAPIVYERINNSLKQYGNSQVFAYNAPREKLASSFGTEKKEASLPGDLKEPLADDEALKNGMDIHQPLKKISPENLSKLQGKKGKELAAAALPASELQNPTQQFLAARNSLTGLKFKEPTGYWANTYVPGDLTVRHLQTTLLGDKPSALNNNQGTRPFLHEASRQVEQPFDVPENSALGLYLHADRTGLQEPSRMLLQVGLKGTKRHSGVRPPMNVSMVFDLRGKLSAEERTQFQEIALALNRAKSAGDRFSLSVAGQAGGNLIPAEHYTHGYLSLGLPKVLAGEGKEGPVWTLAEALSNAAASNADNASEQESTLGNSMVLLVTSQPLGDATSELQKIAYKSAVAGITVSILGLGDKVAQRELDSIALSGQGNRRVLKQGEDAQAIIERELAAVSKVVARALRLRIRLAPGVKLIDVIGSYRLDEAKSGEVRKAEKSIDQRVAKSLGIEADRGEDEEGIQIFIPAFYAENEHVILLDVVAPGPGAIADVRVRYKDMVYLKNASSAASLSLERSEAPAGKLERNVLKNFLALKLSSTLEDAARLLSSGNEAQAVELTKNYQSLLQGLQSIMPDLNGDAEIENDLNMLADYLALMNRQAGKSQDGQNYLASSIWLAGRMKVSPKFMDR